MGKQKKESLERASLRPVNGNRGAAKTSQRRPSPRVITVITRVTPTEFVTRQIIGG